MCSILIGHRSSQDDVSRQCLPCSLGVPVRESRQRPGRELQHRRESEDRAEDHEPQHRAKGGGLRRRERALRQHGQLDQESRQVFGGLSRYLCRQMKEDLFQRSCLWETMRKLLQLQGG